jgi:2-oxoglutarate/2-oxoacid ferredoxin oxidoreductase subunit beta
MMPTGPVPHTEVKTNDLSLTKQDYRGSQSTLCQGCGHNSIANQIISVCFELNIDPSRIMKFSGIGCSSKSPAYFLDRSFGFNGLHGRMPSLAQGAMFADRNLRAFGISGDGDTASIGMGQFKHLIRRNAPLLLVIENNGVYGLTKGQFAPTAEKGLLLKKQGINEYFPIDICMEALASNASFVARSFAGDPRQVKEILKAAFRHNGVAVIDIISPCVTFHNHDDSLHSYAGGKAQDIPLHEITFVPARDEIMVEDFEEGDVRDVHLHDGGVIRLKKLGKDYDPSDRYKAFVVLDDAEKNNLLVTGLFYIDPDRSTMLDIYDLPEMPLNRLEEGRLRPSRKSLDDINQLMF